MLVTLFYTSPTSLPRHAIKAIKLNLAADELQLECRCSGHSTLFAATHSTLLPICSVHLAVLAPPLVLALSN